MDDDELTQEILDQFDLICTQHQYDHVSTYSNNNVNKNNSHSNKLTSCLSRSTSLDTKLNGCIKASDFSSSNDKTPTVERNELDRLKKEVSVLREELYMKLGELATIKELASRTKATDSDMISKLESHLTTERNDFQRKLSELNAQMAFREADYRLVCSELARIKEEVSVSKQLANERSVEYSPASQILISLTSPNPSSISNQKLKTPAVCAPSTDFHLPAPVTPIPSKRHKIPYDGRIWDVNVTNNFDDKSDTTTTTTTNTTTQQTFDKNVHLLDTDEITLSNHYPSRKRQRCVVSPDTRSLYTTTSPEHCIHQIPVSLTDASVETTDLLNSPSSNYPLSYRIRSCAFSTIESFNEFTKGNSELLSELLDLSISIPQNEKNRNSINTNPQTLLTKSFTSSEDFTWLISDYYLTGLSKLLPRQSDIVNEIQPFDSYISRLNLVVKRFTESVPYLIRRIEEQLQACIRILLDPFHQSGKQLNQSCHYYSDSQTGDAEMADKENEQPSNMDDTVDDINSHEISYLGENPFAGAPASQIVTSLTYPSQMKSISKPRMNEHAHSMERNKSCPTHMNYWFSMNSTSGNNHKLPDTDHIDKINHSCSVDHHEIMIYRSIQGINQLKYLASIIHSYCPITFEAFHEISTTNNFIIHNDDSRVWNITKEFQILIRSIASVLSRFINKLADVFFQMMKEEQNSNSSSSSSTTTKSTVVQNEFIGDNTTNITCSIDHSSFKQSQSISSKQKSYISLLSIVLPLITDCLDLASVFAVFIKTDQNLLKTKTADSVVNTTDVAELNTCFPQLLNCIILTSEACFNQADESINFTMTTNDQSKSSNSYNGIENLIKNRTVVTLKPLISFLRLWRQMISQKHWPGGHCSDR
ncbi:unnamed protein product [Schistosoma turkestanicum]|nr:unnamed protein product [Schistosoma turkestanicum]